MTTTVRILIEGNKACTVKVTGADGSDIPGFLSQIVKPNSFATVYIHGEQKVAVVETGDFI